MKVTVLVFGFYLYKIRFVPQFPGSDCWVHLECLPTLPHTGCHEIPFPDGTRRFITAFTRNHFFSRCLCQISHYPSSCKVTACCLPAQPQNLRSSVAANSTYLQLQILTLSSYVNIFSFTCNPNMNTL